jgi:hypothetical protein
MTTSIRPRIGSIDVTLGLWGWLDGEGLGKESEGAC